MTGSDVAPEVSALAALTARAASQAGALWAAHRGLRGNRAG